MNLSKVIKRPVLTEKSVSGETIGKYTFIVHQDATKIDVKNAIKALFGAKVAKVNITKGVAKYKSVKGGKLAQKRPATRKAIVTLAKGEKLSITKIKK